MIEQALNEALNRTDGVERGDDGTFRFSKEHEGTFYFGRQGAVSVSKVLEVTITGGVLRLLCADECAYFTCEELMGFKVKMPAKSNRGGAPAGFSSR